MPEMNKQRIIGMVLIFLLLAIIDKGCNRPTGVGSQSGKSDYPRCFLNGNRMIDATKEIECNYKCDNWVNNEKLYISRDSTCPLNKR
jgi:hypothetical protein